MKSALGTLALLLAALTFALGLAELAARVFLPAPQTVIVRRAPGFDARLESERSNPARSSVPVHLSEDEQFFVRTETGLRLRANAEVTILNEVLSGRRIEIRTNSLGYRNPEIGPKARTRILFLGDSITFGDYLPEEETFVRLVEGRADDLGEDWETINSGVGGISLENELAILIETGLGVEPDAVVLGFYLNDFRESRGVFTPGLPALLEWSVLARRLAMATRWLGAESADESEETRLWRARVDGWRGEFRRAFPVEEGDYRTSREAFNAEILRHFRNWGGAWSPHAWREMTPVFDELLRLSRQHGFQLLIVSFPVRHQVDAAFVYDEPQRQLEQVAARRGIPVLDLLPAFRRAHAEAEREFFYDECHHTPAGNRFIADEIVRFLRSELRTGQRSRRGVPEAAGLLPFDSSADVVAAASSGEILR